MSPPRDAATILLLRAAEPGYEIFMVRRSAKMKFMANAMVFPGGRLDPEDASDALAARCALSRDAAAQTLSMATDPSAALGLLVAGVRETFEEAGALLARRGGQPVSLGDPAEARRFAAHQAALNAKERTFLQVVEAEDLVLAVDALAYAARWITPVIEKRRYDARFLITRVPAGQHPVHDDGETTDSAWLSPQSALAAYDAGDIQLAPPTLRLLLELSQRPSAAQALAYRGPSRETPFEPQPHFEGQELHLLLPGDPDFAPAGGERNRMILRDERWVSEGRGA